MTRILAVSSLVAKGHVGLSVMVPALEQLGFDVIGLPTVLLSNHKGHAHCAGTVTPPETLAEMLKALGENGWLDDIDAVITGFMPTADHVAFAAEAVTRVRQSAARRQHRQRPLYLCDPVMGDLPGGLYVPSAVADALFDALIPLADIATPNAFEAFRLVDAPDAITAADAAVIAAPALNIPTVVVTSVASANAPYLDNILIEADGSAYQTRVDVRPHAPHGTGDLFAAMMLAARLADRAPSEALSFATAAVDHALRLSDTAIDAGSAHTAHASSLSPRHCVRSFDAIRPWPVITVVPLQ